MHYHTKLLSDIRLIMLGSVVMFGGFYVGSLAGSEYAQMSLQTSQFDECFDYSSGTPTHVSCAEMGRVTLLYLSLTLALLGGGAYLIFKGIKGRWDQNVKSDEMLGPKHG